MTNTRSERGSMAVELVILTPVLVMVMMLMVAFGRYVNTEGEVESAARDAVRAATLERDSASAAAAAQAVASSAIPGSVTCGPVAINGNFIPGETITANLTCEVSYDGLGLLGLPGSVPITGESSAPLDEFRRAG